MRKRFHGAARPVKYEFIASDIHINLNSSNSLAVAVDNLLLTWQRGHRTTAPKKARVVERLDQMSGELSRTAQLVAAELTIPCTLFKVGGEDGRFESKLSQLQLSDADAEQTEDGLLCAVNIELSMYAASTSAPVHRARAELPLPDDMGSITLTICSRLLTGASEREDGCSNAGSDITDITDALHGPLHDETGGSSMGTPEKAAASPRVAAPRDGVEARWQEVYEMERATADALTIEGLQTDLAALIADKRTLSEELLKLRITVSGMPLGKRALAERIAELEAQVRAPRRLDQTHAASFRCPRTALCSPAVLACCRSHACLPLIPI